MAVYQGNSGPDSFRGGTTDDSIYGRQGADTLIGGGGNDLIYGGMDNDAITVGGAGSRSLVYGGEGLDSIFSLGGQNTILGGTGINTLDPNDGDDLINAQADGAGDLILGNGGADTILGSSMQGASFGQKSNALTQIFGGKGNDFIISGFSPSIVIESIADIPVGPSTPVILVGNEGDDTILAVGSQSTVYGGQGSDSIGTGSAGNDLLFGGEGSDTIIGFASGNLTISGGTGVQSIDSTSIDGADLIKIGSDDTNALIVSAGNSLVLGNFGDDTIDVSLQGIYTSGPSETAPPGGSDQLLGGQGNDSIIVGFLANNLILGNEGNDTISAAFVQSIEGLDFTFAPVGNNTVYGGQGDDVITMGNMVSVSNDLVYGGEGNDAISIYGGGSNTVYGGTDSVGSDDGSNFIDISGVASQDGSAAVLRERVYGGSGMDAVSVGSAIDAVTISGNGGTNQYAFTANTASTTVLGGAGSGLDQITDFISGTDKFLLNSVGGAKLTVNSVFGAGAQDSQGNLTAAANAAEATASIQGANAATFSFGGSNYLVVNGDASGGFTSGNDILINIAGTTSLTKNDFL